VARRDSAAKRKERRERYHVEAVDEELAAEGLVDLVGLQVLDLLPGERRRRHDVCMWVRGVRAGGVGVWVCRHSGAR
jgi:ribosomal protein L32